MSYKTRKRIYIFLIMTALILMCFVPEEVNAKYWLIVIAVITCCLTAILLVIYEKEEEEIQKPKRDWSDNHPQNRI